MPWKLSYTGVVFTLLMITRLAQAQESQARLTGRVTEAANGSPIEGATVTLFPPMIFGNIQMVNGLGLVEVIYLTLLEYMELKELLLLLILLELDMVELVGLILLEHFGSLEDMAMVLVKLRMVSEIV